MSTLSNAPLLATLADEALLHGSTGPQAGDAEDASSQPPASPAEKGAPRPTARWYLGEVDALRLHIPVKSAKGLMELRWALGQKPPEHLTIIADQLPEGDRRHMQRFDVRSDDNWTMRASPETWNPLSGKLARAVLQGGSDKLPRGTKLALSAGKLEGEVHLKVLQQSSASFAAKSRHQAASPAAPAAISISSTSTTGQAAGPSQQGTQPSSKAKVDASAAAASKAPNVPSLQKQPPQLVQPSAQQASKQTPHQPQQAAAANQQPKQAASPAAGPSQQQHPAKTATTPAKPAKQLKQQPPPPPPPQQPQQQQQQQRKHRKKPKAPSSSLSHGSHRDGFFLRVNNPDALMLSKRLLRTLFQDSTWPPVLQIRVPGAATLLPAATESSTSGRLLGRKGWSAVAAALSAGARAPLQQGSVLHIFKPLSGTTGELRMRLVEGQELADDVRAAAALTASTHWTSSVGYLHYEPTREGSSGGKRQRSGSLDAALSADKKRAARPSDPAPPSSVPAADSSLTIPAPPPAVAAAASGVTAQQQPKSEAINAPRTEGS